MELVEGESEMFASPQLTTLSYNHQRTILYSLHVKGIYRKALLVLSKSLGFLKKKCIIGNSRVRAVVGIMNARNSINNFIGKLLLV